MLVNHAAARLQRRGLAQSQIQGMNVAAGVIDGAADIPSCTNPGADSVSIQQFQLVITESAPQRLLGFQVLELL